MSISCDCSNEGYDHADIYQEEYPVARKPHRCCECGEIIQPGQKHHKVRGLWDGSWDTFRTCMTCYNIRDHYCSHGYVFGGLREALGECLGFDYTDIPEEED